MHSPNFMLPLLVNLSIHYPKAGRTPAQLQILAEDWAEDLAGFSPDIVTQAVKQTRRECAFFPTVADIAERCGTMQRGREARAQALPETTMTLDEQRAMNSEWGAKIIANMRRHMDARTSARQPQQAP